MSKSVRIFVSYAQKDYDLKEELDVHLAMLKRNPIVDMWSDRTISPGEEWDSEIKNEIKECDLFIALISPRYLASSYILDHELEVAFERAKTENLKIVPIILKSCDWQATEFANFLCLPSNGTPVSRYDYMDEGFTDVVIGLKKIIDSIVSEENKNIDTGGKYYSKRGVSLLEFPSELANFKDLESIDLSKNEIQFIPKSIVSHKGLKQLNLKGNKISEIPEYLSQLQNLEVINLSNNEIKYIPGFIFQMKSLKSLYLDNNQLTNVLPKSIDLNTLENLTLFNNSILNLPKELFEFHGDIAANLKSYFTELEQNRSSYFYEAKLIIVGAGGAGKTTLARKLIDPQSPLPHNYESTKGIDVIPFMFSIGDDSQIKFKANIWDFGGQAIYHATHQFFLTERSLYVLLVDNRKEDTDFDYWLSVIDLFSNGSPVIVAINEKENRKKDIDLKKLQSYYPFILNAYNSNFANNKGLQILSTAIKSRILELDHIGTKIPSKWLSIRESLINDTRNYITYFQFISICETYGIEDEKSAITISKFLHDLGITLHFIEDEVLSNFVILNPEWGTDAVYKVLDDDTISLNNGKFNDDDLERVWSGGEYNLTARKALIRLMKKFGLCYEIGTTMNYIAPQLLPEERLDYNWEILSTDIIELQFKFEYNFMPKGILHRLIAQMNRFIFNINGNDLVWKNGVVFKINEAIAEVMQNTFSGEKNISIRLKGNRRKELLSIIREELKDIHSTYNENLEFYEEMIPCCCNSNCRNEEDPHFFKEKIIYKAKSKGVSSLQCVRSFEQVLIEDLINGVKPENRTEDHETLRVFISYSRKDTGLREKLETHLVNLKKNKMIQSWVDYQIDPGKEWENEIMTSLNSSDIILLLISPDFNFSSYCDKELKIALSRHDKEEAVVIPIIIRPCDWQFTEMAKLNVLPKAGVPVTKWDNIDEALLDISLGLRRVVENRRNISLT